MALTHTSGTSSKGNLLDNKPNIDESCVDSYIYIKLGMIFLLSLAIIWPILTLLMHIPFTLK